MEKTKVIYFDMDGVLADFQSGIEAANLSDHERMEREASNSFDEVPNIFSLMKPIPGAIEGVKKLSRYYDVRILTTAPWDNPSAWSDKLLWVKRYFDNTVKGFKDGNPFYKRITITHHKDRALGNILVEDNLSKNGAGTFHGEKIWFHLPGNKVASCPESLQMMDIKEVMSWNDLIDYLMPPDND